MSQPGEQQIENVFYARVGRTIVAIIGLISMTAFVGVLGIRDTANGNVAKLEAIATRVAKVEGEGSAITEVRERLGIIIGQLVSITERLSRLEEDRDRRDGRRGP